MERKRCVIYVRVSTAMQVDGYSLSAQKEYLIDYAKRNNMIIVEEYEDAGKSGKSIEGRPAFQKMMKDVENCLSIDCVLVFKLSRFGRSAADILTSVNFLKDYGISLIAASDGIDSGTSSGRLIISVLSAVAEIERENIMEQTMAGRREKARQGKWNGGFPPYGYDLKDGILIINEEEAKVVKEIFEMYATGKMTTGDMRKYLDLHYPRFDRVKKAYCKWSDSGIKYVLDNEIYLGLMPYGKKRKEKIKGTRNDYHRVPKTDYMKEKGMHEAIISEELFEKVRKRRLNNKLKVTEGRKKVHLLSDLVICPYCKKNLIVYKRRRKNINGEDYYATYYLCNNNINHSIKKDFPCEYDNKIPAEAIEKVVLDLIEKLSKKTILKDIIEKELSTTESKEQLNKDIEAYEEKYKDLNKKKNIVLSEIDSLSTNDPAYLIKTQDLTRRLDNFYSEMTSITTLLEESYEKLNNITSQSLNADNILDIIKGTGSIIKTLDSKDQKILIHKVIDSIELKAKPDETNNPIKRISFKFPLFKDQYETNDIEWDRNNLPYIYQRLEGSNEKIVVVEVDDVIGKMKFPKVTHERYKPKTKNRPTKVDSDESLVEYVNKTYNIKTSRKAIMNVRHQLQGKEVKGYLPKGQKYLVIKETLERFGKA